MRARDVEVKALPTNCPKSAEETRETEAVGTQQETTAVNIAEYSVVQLQPLHANVPWCPDLQPLIDKFSWLPRFQKQSRSARYIRQLLSWCSFPPRTANPESMWA